MMRRLLSVHSPSAAVLCGLLLSGCWYNVERKWVHGHELGLGSSAPAQPFRPSLVACVATNDPSKLSAIVNGGDYPLSGWFLDNNRLSAVERCMSAHGWLAMPTTLITP